MFVARLSVAFALVFSQGLFVKEIFNQPNANPTSGGDQSTQVIPTVPVQNIPPLSPETLLPELVPKRVRKFSIFGPADKSEAPNMSSPVDHDEASEPVLAQRRPLIAPVFKATTPLEILYEVSSNGTFANAPKWKLNLITAQIRKYGELNPVDQIRPQLELLLAETSLDPTKRIIVAWLDYLPKVFT